MEAFGDPREILIGTSLALSLGALVGLERQVSEGESGGVKDFPGVRTFAFTALLGALAVLVSKPLGPWMGVALFLAVVSFLVLRYRYDVSLKDDPGYTTEVASLCTFVVGALAQSNQFLIATIITIAMAALLRWKRALHQAGDLMRAIDMEALIRFLVITGIVLPLLPDEPLDLLFGVLRPRDVWRMVVLISGLSFGAYVLMRFRGGPGTYVLTGLLGGFVSSTAATVAYARAARGESGGRYETMATLAATTSFLRIAIMVAVIAPELVLPVAGTLSTMFAVGLVVSLFRARPRPTNGQPDPELTNPLGLSTAFTFAAIYAVVLVAVEAMRVFVGRTAVYATGAMAALAGADAPTLSISRLARDGRLALDDAAFAIVIVAIVGTLAKAALALLFGPRGFGLRIGATLAAIALSGAIHFYLAVSGAIPGASLSGAATQSAKPAPIPTTPKSSAR